MIRYGGHQEEELVAETDDEEEEAPNKVILTSDLRLSQTHYKDKNSSHNFFKADVDDDDAERPM